MKLIGHCHHHPSIKYVQHEYARRVFGISMELSEIRISNKTT